MFNLISSIVAAPSIDPIEPNSDLLGTTTLRDLVGGVMTIGLVVCGLAIIVGGVLLAIDHWGEGNMQMKTRGKKTVIGGIIGSAIIGGVWTIQQFAVDTGSGIAAPVINELVVELDHSDVL